MARPLKVGMDYFPTDVHIDEDYKLFDLFDSIGTDRGLGIVILLLSAIYEGEGYYLEWNDSVCRKFARKKQLDKDTLKKAVEILTGTCREVYLSEDDKPFFNKDLFRDEKILTSAGIQKRFFIGAERRKERKINKSFLLLPYEHGEIQTGFKTESGKKVPKMEITNYVVLDKKEISFQFLVSALIQDNANINNINGIINISENVNEVNVSNNTQTKTNQKEKEKEKEKERINTFPPVSPQPFEEYSGKKELPKDSLSSRITDSIEYWNTFDSLPKCKYSVLNLPNIGEVRTKFDVFSLEEINQAISNLGRFIRFENFKPSSFDRFIINSLDRWLESCNPADRYEDHRIKSDTEKELAKVEEYISIVEGSMPEEHISTYREKAADLKAIVEKEKMKGAIYA